MRRNNWLTAIRAGLAPGTTRRAVGPAPRARPRVESLEDRATPALFGPATNYATGNVNPQDVAVGDFNGDGKPDLVTANFNGSTVGVFSGNGNGTFQAQRTFASGAEPTAVAVGDFNGDGKLDLAVTRGGNGLVSLLLGNGDGTFQAPHDFPIGDNSSEPEALAVGDFNGDGKLDLVTANAGNGVVSVLLGNGTGNFLSHQDYSPGTNSGVRSVVVGDFNGDGKLDLATANPASGTVGVLLGNGDGTFQAAQDFSTGSDPYGVTVGDFNGDGKPDLATANAGNATASVLLGNGNGTFQAHQDFSTGSDAFSVAVGDFNGDGKPDLAATNTGTNTVGVLLGNGNGTFQAQQTFATAVTPVAVAVGDFNGDGKPDLATANTDTNFGNSVSVLLNTSVVLTITPAQLPATHVGAAYSQALTATGGTGPYTFTVPAGTALDGLSLSPAGVLSGTPTAAGTFAFTVTATDGTGAVGRQSYSLVVNAGIPLLPGLVPLYAPSDPYGPRPNADQNTAFVKGLYRTVLGRDAASGEVAYWVGQLASGRGTSAIALYFWNSPEHRYDEVNSYYQQYLGRPGDPNGLAYWAGLLGSGQLDEAGVSKRFLTSPEATARAATSVAYVDLLYTVALGRPADANGEAYWANQLNTGALTRAQLAVVFLQSPESYARLVTSLFQTILHRSAVPNDIQSLVNVLAPGNVSLSAMAVAFVGGTEFYADAGAYVG